MSLVCGCRTLVLVCSISLMANGQNFIGDAADSTIADVKTVNFTDMVFYAGCGHALGIHGDDFLFDVAGKRGLVLF